MSKLNFELEYASPYRKIDKDLLDKVKIFKPEIIDISGQKVCIIRVNCVNDLMYIVNEIDEIIIRPCYVYRKSIYSETKGNLPLTGRILIYDDYIE